MQNEINANGQVLPAAMERVWRKLAGADDGKPKDEPGFFANMFR